MRALTLIVPALALVAVLAADPAAAQRRSYDIMVEEGGKPLKKQGRKATESPDPGSRKKPQEPRTRPRGSSYVPPTGLPRTEAITIPQSPGVYKPPRVNSFSDRVINCNHSFPLNAGVGNNPTDRSSYVRQCAN